MKQLTRKLLMLGAALALMSAAPALAAGETAPADQAPVIAVQLDGETLTFPDAVPQAKDGRTFLPFRAVFEAMGAEVSNEGSVITAIRGDRTLTMTIGETNATVTTAGATLPLQMDVAPYVDTTTWRTYVPVRFAAQALGCAVGWDQEAYTAIIVDTDKLVEKALEGKQFTYLDKYTDYSKRFNEGIWNTDMTLTGRGTMTTGDIVMTLPFSAQAKGITQDQAKLEMDMNMKIDMSSLTEQIKAEAQATGESAEMGDQLQAMIDALGKEGISLSIRGDITEGKLAMLMEGEALTQMGMPQNTWFSMDLAAMTQQTGLDYASLLTMSTSQTFDPAALVKTFLTTMTPTAATNEGYGISYQTFVDSAENVALALSDKGFTKKGSDYTCSIDGGLNKLSLTLTMKNGKVVGYSMVMTMTQTVGESSAYTVMDMTVNEKDQFSATMTMDMADTTSTMNMEMELTGGYTKGKTAPQTQPPEGVGIIDMNALIPMPL